MSDSASYLDDPRRSGESHRAIGCQLEEQLADRRSLLPLALLPLFAGDGVPGVEQDADTDAARLANGQQRGSLGFDS